MFTLKMHNKQRQSIQLTAKKFIPFITAERGQNKIIITDEKHYQNYTNFKTYNASNDFFKRISNVPYVHEDFQCRGKRSTIFSANTCQNKDAVSDQH